MRRLPLKSLTLLWGVVLGTMLLAQPKPSDNEDLDFLNKLARTAPASAPAATKPLTQESPFKVTLEDGRRRGVVTLSDGEKIRGMFSTTADKPIRIWDPAAKEYRDVPFELIKTMEAKVLWEREEKEWHFRESGSDLKEYTGKTYPARETEYTVTLVNGQTITGGISAPLFAASPTGDKTVVLYKRSKGLVGKTLKDLVYVKRVDLEEEKK